MIHHYIVVDFLIYNFGMVIKIFTDGASRGNPGKGGWGAIIETNDQVIELGGREKHTTNNRMELMAVIRALEYISKHGFYECLVTIHTDSSYVLKGATLWLPGWKVNSWKTKNKKDVVNSDLWRSLDQLLFSSIDWKLLPGHSHIPGNERCDEIATAFADERPINLFSGHSHSYAIDLSNIAPLKQKKSTKVKNTGKVYSYVSLVKGVVQTHPTWSECEARVKGVPKARFKKVFSKQEEDLLIEQWKKM